MPCRDKHDFKIGADRENERVYDILRMVLCIHHHIWTSCGENLSPCNHIYYPFFESIFVELHSGMEGVRNNVDSR